MGGGIFKKQQFRCAGCGKGVTAKVTVPPTQATLPVGPPPGWGGFDVIAQHPDTGAIGSYTAFVCSEACFTALQAGEGVGKLYIDRFKAAFAGGQPALSAVPPVEAPTAAADVPPDDGAGC